MGAAKTTNFSVVRIDEESIRQLCLAKIGQSDRFCVSRHVRSKRRRGVKFVPLLNHFYMPAGNLSASTDTYIPIDDVPSKYRDKFNRGTMSCRQWSHLFVDAMHDVSFEEFDDMPRGALEEQEREEENFSYQHEDVMDEDTVRLAGEELPVFEFADDLDGLGVGLECEILVPPMREQHIALDMLRRATSLAIEEHDRGIQSIQGVLAQTVQKHLAELGELILEHGTLGAALEGISNERIDRRPWHTLDIVRTSTCRLRPSGCVRVRACCRSYTRKNGGIRIEARG